MPTELINRIKTFNRPTIKTELAALSIQGFSMSFAGFENARLDRMTPFPESSRVIGRKRQSDGSVLEDSADTGELRVTTRDALTAGELTSLNTVLDDHDATVDDPSQDKRRQTDVDVAALRATFDAGIADPTDEIMVRLMLLEYGEDV